MLSQPAFKEARDQSPGNSVLCFVARPLPIATFSLPLNRYSLRRTSSSKIVMKMLQSHWTFRVIILATVCAIVAALFNAARTPSLSSAAQTPMVPPPPTQRAERFGIYNWNIDYAAYSESSNLDRLNWGAERVAEIGSRTIHAFL